MVDRRRHRGPHPADEEAFSPAFHPRLLMAVHHLAWLLTRGYADRSALKLVGDRFSLTKRQRSAVHRSTCSDPELERRRDHRVDLARLRGEEIWIDGYNLLITVEAALAGGIVLAARDGCFRDLASMHGTFRNVEETVPALVQIGKTLEHHGVARGRWFLDRPVSNSGRLKEVILQIAVEEGWSWEVELVPDPDQVLVESEQVVASADSGVLDRADRWVNLARAVITARVPTAHILDLSPEAPD